MKIVKKFIETKIINHKFNNRRRYDAGYNVIINYNGVKMRIENNKSFDNKRLIYDRTQKMLQNILNKKDNFIIKVFNNLKNLFQKVEIK